MINHSSKLKTNFSWYCSFYLSTIIGLLMVTTLPIKLQAKTVMLNGKDISNVRKQHLKKVDIYITEEGDIVIQAPHYQVQHVDSYQPIKITGQTPSLMNNTPIHKAPAPLNADSSGVRSQAIEETKMGEEGMNNSDKKTSSTSANSSAQPIDATSDAKINSNSSTLKSSTSKKNVESNNETVEDERLTPKAGTKAVP